MTLQYHIRENLNRDYLAPESDPPQAIGQPEIPAYLTCRSGAQNCRSSSAWWSGLQTTGVTMFWAVQKLRTRCNRLPVAQPAMARSSSMPVTSSGATRCRTILPGREVFDFRIVDPKRVGIGCYTVVARAGRRTFTPICTPRLSTTLVLEPEHLAGDNPTYWEAGRRFHQRMGDPEHFRARTDRQSPLNSATKIKTLARSAGRKRSTVNKRSGPDRYRTRRGFPVEYTSRQMKVTAFSGQQHGGRFQAEKFSPNTGGRYQKAPP